ncbi:MAG: DUF4296 domain-containing protein [Bacteroidetes bacterium]|nr:MAG: DUF4296 domain-containing protein [Bacteroidota bacterium]
MNKCLALLLPLLLCFACRQKEERFPLNDEQIVAILTDVHLAEAALANIGGPLKDSLAEIYYGQVFEIHQIDQTRFDSLMDYLQNHPVYMDSLYQRVLKRMEQQRQTTETSK